MPRKYTPQERIAAFWNKVAITADDEQCWEWTAGRMHGYGRFGGLYSHRVSWELAHGELSKDLDVLHSCDNPACVNPKHLFLGTHVDNMKDMADKNRSPFGERHTRCKLSSNQVQYIRDRYAQGGITTRELGAEMGVSHVHIVLIVNNKSRAKA